MHMIDACKCDTMSFQLSLNVYSQIYHIPQHDHELIRVDVFVEVIERHSQVIENDIHSTLSPSAGHCGATHDEPFAHFR